MWTDDINDLSTGLKISSRYRELGLAMAKLNKGFATRQRDPNCPGPPHLNKGFKRK